MMTMLPPDADRILMQWREGVLDLARSLRRIPGLPAEVAEGAEALEEARRLLDAVGIAAAPEDFALLALKERHLAVAVLTLLAHQNKPKHINANITKNIRICNNFYRYHCRYLCNI